MDTLFSRVRDKVNSVKTKHASRKTINIKPGFPVISFTFDDFPVSAYKKGGKILNEANAKGTFYISLKFLDKATIAGAGFSSAVLNELLNDGHELGCHTFDHLDAAINTHQEFEASMRKNQNSLSEILGSEYSLDNFAYPFGRSNAKLKGIISRRFKTSRGTSWGINSGKTDLNLLNACKLYGKKDPEGLIRKIIKRNEELKGWLVFYTHDVQDNPSDFGCTPDLLKYTLNLAKESGAEILPINAAYDLFTKKNR